MRGIGMRGIGQRGYVPGAAANSGYFYDDFSAATLDSRWTTLLGTLATNSGALRASAIASDTYNLLLNADFEAGDPPTSWVANGVVLASVADTRTGGSGAKAMSVARAGYDFADGRQTVTAIVGATYAYSGWSKNIDVASAYFSSTNPAGEFGFNPGDWAQATANHTPTSATVALLCKINAGSKADGTTGRYDDLSYCLQSAILYANPNTPNAQVVASMVSPASAVTPRAVLLRVTDALNYVRLLLLPNTAGNDTILQTVTAGVIANVSGGAADVDWTAGGTDRVRVTVQGNSYTVEHMKAGAYTWTTAFTATSASFATSTLFGPQLFAAADDSFADIRIQGA